MRRHRLLSAIAAAASALAVAGCATSSSSASRTAGTITPAAGPRELLPEEQVQHVLNRLAFGPRPGDAERVRAMGVDAWIARQLDPASIDDLTTDSLVAGYEMLRTPTPQLVAYYREAQEAQRRAQLALRAAGDTSATRRDARREAIQDNPELREIARRQQRVVGALQSAKLARAVASERQLQEVMTDFWENHFSVFAGKGQTRLFLAEYDRDVIRPRALGRFRDLLGAVAKSPAMLFFLDNFQSMADSAHATVTGNGARGQRLPIARQLAQRRRARGLNENYARELMELHTLGVDGGYTQRDVIEVARALTGWTIDLQSGRFVFRPQMHDADAKTVLGHTLAAGRGIEDGEEVLDLVARHPSTARYVTTKLARRFVADEPPAALVDRCAGVFAATDGDIRETVGCIVRSPEFFSRVAYRAKVKNPFDVVASALRALGARPDTTPRAAQVVARLGQPIFGRQTPDGWPERGDAWMNTGAILNRINFGLAVAGGRVPGASLADWPPSAQLRGLAREAQADGVIRALLGGTVSPATRSILVSGENPMLARVPRDSITVAMSAPGGTGLDRPTAAARVLDRPVSLDGLAQVVGLALGAPEFQRR